jgi:hypothetical protein
MEKNPAKYERYTSLAKIHRIFRLASPASLLGIFAGYYQTALVDDSRMIKTQMGNAQ